MTVKEKLSMIGHVIDTPRVIKNAYNNRNDYMQDFVNSFVNHNFKKVYFLGSGTSHHVSWVIKNIFVDLLLNIIYNIIVKNSTKENAYGSIKQKDY